MLTPNFSDSGIPDKRRMVLLLTGIILIAFNLRPALASIGPLIGDIRLATGLSNSTLGFLTTLPLISFGIISTLTPLFTRRFGMGGTLLGAMFLLAAGVAIRSHGSVGMLYTGTLLAGIAIAFGNVLLPSLTKHSFASNSGMVTSLYSSFMAVGAAVAAGISVPLSRIPELGWRGSLGFWVVPALLAALVWWYQPTRFKRAKQNRGFRVAMSHLGTSRLAWQIALFMGLQSLTFYVILAWSPAILQSRGFDAAFSGWMLSLCQATGILGSLIIPMIAGRRRDQRSIVIWLVGLELIGITGLLLPALGLISLWMGIMGFVLGGTFGLALLLIVIRSRDAESATELSGMAQSIGYLVAATGPWIFGSLFDLTGSWTYPILLLFAISALKLITGYRAAVPGSL